MIHWMLRHFIVVGVRGSIHLKKRQELSSIRPPEPLTTVSIRSTIFKYLTYIHKKTRNKLRALGFYYVVPSFCSLFQVYTRILSLLFLSALFSLSYRLDDNETTTIQDKTTLGHLLSCLTFSD